jgi:hypothetical protein
MHFVAHGQFKDSCIYCAEYCTRRARFVEGENSYSVICCRECENTNFELIKYLLFNRKSQTEYSNEIKYWKNETSYYKKEYEYHKKQYEILKIENETLKKKVKKDLFA